MIGSTIAASVDDGLDKMAKHARTVLVVLAAISFGGALLLWLAEGTVGAAELAPQFASGLTFAALAVWARRSPMVPVAIGVGLYGLSLVVTLVLDPTRFFGMWSLIINGIIVALCINGISAARSYERLKTQLAAAKR